LIEEIGVELRLPGRPSIAELLAMTSAALDFISLVIASEAKQSSILDN